MLYKVYPRSKVNYLISMPFIYGMIIPLVFVDICVEIYHHVCFRLYGLEIVPRRKYIKIDRHKLSYLNTFEKINCAYCGYANGLASYLVAIAAETEKYWCGIKHANDPNFITPSHHKDFIEYNDEEGYKKLINNRNT